MTDKQLKDKAIDIKGKQYVLVSDRINYFNDNYPNGSITTNLISDTNSTYVMKAIVIPDVEKSLRHFTGYSQAKIGQGMVNTTAALENCETSAVGRALAMMGIGVIDSVASVDEIKKADFSMAKSPDHQDNEFKDSKCQKCGGRIAISQGGKPYCINRCWLPENKHFQDEFNKTVKEGLTYVKE
jgi:hypothetical protein